jgi:ABC-type sugar transport system ATPase subunit
VDGQGAGFAITAEGIRKSFGGVAALRDVGFRVRRGEIHALLGQNGAGKSTLVKILNGVHPAGSFEGTITVEGRPVAFQSPHDARAAGVAYVPQEIEVLEQLTAAENVFAGQTGLGRGKLVNQRRLQQEAGRLFEQLGLAIDPRRVVASLAPAQRQLVMIVRALAIRPAVLMLDEPTASLSGTEVDRLLAVLRRLRAQGMTMVYITHRLSEVLAICDRVSVLRDGATVAELERGRFDADVLINAVSGRRVQRQFPEHDPPVATAPPRLSVEELSVPAAWNVPHAVHGVSFTVRAGEILGIAGLLGSGRTELLSAIYGRFPCRGHIRVDGEAVTIRSTRDARHAGIALLTEDRKRDGLLYNLSARGNITIGNLDAFASAGVLHTDRERTGARQAMRALAIRASSTEASVTHLSGGNQQKLLMARVLMNRPKVLLLDEPTKGVDVVTRQEIYRLVVDLAHGGIAVIVVSSELEEVIGLADRTVVISDGRIVDEFLRGAGGEDRVLRSIAAAETALAIRVGAAGEAA